MLRSGRGSVFFILWVGASIRAVWHVCAFLPWTYLSRKCLKPIYKCIVVSQCYEKCCVFSQLRLLIKSIHSPHWRLHLQFREMEAAATKRSFLLTAEKEERGGFLARTFKA